MDSFEETDEEVEIITIISEDADPETSQIEEVITIHVTNDGPEGVAAISAKVSRRQRRRLYDFEIHPNRRIKHYKRLMRVLLRNIHELSTRVGKQVALVVAGVGSSAPSYQVFGSQLLRDVIRNNENSIVDDLRKAFASWTQFATQPGSAMTELPELVFEGVTIPVRRLSQIQLRSFIPTMIRYSVGRGQPRWGVPDSKPCWWPRDVPWSNIRTDIRSDAAKRKVSWTNALRQVVVNCYNFHRRIDLLPIFSEEDFRFNLSVAAMSPPENGTTEIQEDKVDVESEPDAAGSSTFSDLATKLERYLDDLIQYEDLAGDSRLEFCIYDEDQSDEKNDAVQTEENMDDADLVDNSVQSENQIGHYDDNSVQSEDMHDAVQTEENVDGAVQTEENIDGTVQTEENMYHAVQCGENMDGAVQTEEDTDDADLVDNSVQFENQIGHYDDNSVQSEDMHDAVLTEENVDGAVQTEENIDGTVQTEENMYRAVQCGENMDGAVQSEKNRDDAVQTEEKVVDVVQTEKNIDGAVQTEYPARQKPIVTDINDADQSKDLAGENLINYYFMVDAIQPEDNMGDADLPDEKHLDNSVRLEYLTEENQIQHFDDNTGQTEENMEVAVQTEKNMDGAVQIEYPAKQNPIGADINDADQSKDLAGGNLIYYFMVDAIQPEDNMGEADLADGKRLDNAVQFEYLAEENQIEHFNDNTGQTEKNIDGAVQTEYPAKQNPIVADINDAYQTKDLAGENLINYYFMVDAIQPEDNMGDEKHLDNSVRLEYLTEENQIQHFDDNTDQTEENMEVAVQTEKNMDGAVQIEYPAKQNPIVADINDADQSKDLAGENLINYYFTVDSIQPEENMDVDMADEKHVDNAIQSEENMKDADLADENHVENAVQFEYMAEENRTGCYDDNAVQFEYLAGVNQTAYYDGNAVQSDENMDDAYLADGKHIDNADQSEENMDDADYNTGSDFESDDDGAESNDSEATVKIAFRYEENLSIKNQEQFQHCDSTSDETISKVCSFRSEEDGVVLEDRPICDDNGGPSSTIYPDTTVVGLMDYDRDDDFSEIEEDMDVDLASDFSPAGRIFLTPITAEMMNRDEPPFGFDLSQGKEYTLEAIDRKFR